MPSTSHTIASRAPRTRIRPRSRRRSRSRWLRHPVAGRVATASLAVMAGAVTAGVVARAESATSAYGSRRPVAVALHRLDPGTEIADTDVEMRELPVAVLPDGVADDAVGRVVVDAVQPGEPLLVAHLARSDAHGPAALVATGHRAVAIPLDGPPPPVRTGDLVDALGGRDARTVATRALVIDVSDRAVTIAVADDEVGGTAQAVLYGPVVLVLDAAG